MKAFVSATLTLPIVGDTGYQNRSALAIDLLDMGLLKLPRDEWDLTPMLGAVLKIKSLTLSIPSGELTLKENLSVTVENGKNFIITGDGEWHGIVAGLFGGMSGYAAFQASVQSVTEGTYKCPSLDDWEVDPKVYFERIARHRAFAGDREARESAAIAARLKQRPASQLSRADKQWLRDWEDWLLKTQTLSPEEFIATVNDNRLYRAAATSDELLPESVIQELKATESFSTLQNVQQVFAERVYYQLTWGKTEEERTTERRWAICVPIGETHRTWWATLEEAEILEKHRKSNGEYEDFEYDDAELEYEDYGEEETPTGDS